MIRTGLVALLSLSVLAVAAAPGDAALRDRLRERMAKRMGAQIANDQTTDGREIAYGRDPLQTLSFWAPATRGERPAPLILFVHGGGWKRGDKSNAPGKAKAAHFRAQGYAFASVNYRLVPEATVEQQAADVAAALARLRADAAGLGIDPGRIVLMGHSAGAHLVALVGTDPAWLHAAGLSPGDIAGIIPIDGAAYDVPSQMTVKAPLLGDTYAQAFGSDPSRQRALSPTHHAAAPNAGPFLILHVQRRDGTAQARGLAEALRSAGTPAQVEAFAGTGLQGHIDINRKLGLPDYPATPVVDAWLRARFAP